MQHIMLFTDRQNDSVNVVAKQRIDSIYEVLMNGADFAAMAREYSQDHGSSFNGGELPWFGTGRMIPEFEAAAFALQTEGEISRPIRSAYGWHIIRLMGKRSLGSYEDMRADILQQIERDNARSAIVANSFTDKCKAEFGYSLNEANWQTFCESALGLMPTDSSYLEGPARSDMTIFTYAGKHRTGADVAAYLSGRSTRGNALTQGMLNEALDGYVAQEMREAELRTLESKHADFRNLMNEYHDGILLFDVSNEAVWDRAQQDTLGLEACFNSHRERYTWQDAHFKGYLIYCSDEATAKTASRIARNASGAEMIHNLELRLNTDSVKSVHVNRVLVANGDVSQSGNSLVEENVFVRKLKIGKRVDVLTPNSGRYVSAEQFPWVAIVGKVIAQPESYEDIRGQVAADYQDQLEEEWVESLRRKFPVVINERVWKAMLEGEE